MNDRDANPIHIVCSFVCFEDLRHKIENKGKQNKAKLNYLADTSIISQLLASERIVGENYEHAWHSL